VSTKLDANDISSMSTSEVNAINLSLEVDTVNLLVLLVFFFNLCTTSTKLDSNDILSSSTLRVDVVDLSSTSTLVGCY
jgi:hypothetical protein